MLAYILDECNNFFGKIAKYINNLVKSDGRNLKSSENISVSGIYLMGLLFLMQ